MQTVRNTLEKLGWPVNEMSDKQITQDLYRRWFRAQQDTMEDEDPVSVASATGVVVSMACEGNLDALCWSEDDVIPEEDLVSQEDEDLFFHEPDDEPYPYPDRRESPRSPGRDIVSWYTPFTDGAAGWLVDYSAGGIAFIAETEEAPGVGEAITPSIHSRAKGTVELGPATVVRIEPLNPELSLVCVKLEEEPSSFL
jgi:hypothetical protein